MPTRNDGEVLKILNEAANSIVEQAKTNSSWSKDIPKAISFKPAVVTSDGYEVDIELDASPNGPAPQAAAFEFGSGIHATKGTKGTYKIRPKTAGKFLYFPWNPENPVGALMSEKVEDFWDEADLWVFREVDHPGVAPRAFMTPAIQQKLPELEQKINQAARVLLSFGDRVEVIK